MTAPDLAAVRAYLGDVSYSDDEISSALEAETAAQRAVVTYPSTDVALIPSPDFTSVVWQKNGNLTLTKELGWLRVQGTPVGYSFVTGGTLQEAAATNVPFAVKVSFTYLRQSTRTLSFSYNHSQVLDAPVGVPTAFTGLETVVDYNVDSTFIWTASGSGAVDYAFRDLVVELPGQAPNDLKEALCRRVARNLAMRALPLGLQSAISEGAVGIARVGQDPEIRRLEAPWRRLVVG